MFDSKYIIKSINQKKINFYFQLFGDNTSSSSQLFPYSFENDINAYYNINGVGGGDRVGSGGNDGRGGINSSYNNITGEAGTTNNHFYDNLYTPFGSSGGGGISSGTTYYANPFATGFDFGATVTANSQLHATAPEFVPRFNNLSLNDGSGGGDFVAELKGNGGETLEQLKNNFNNSSSNSLEPAFAAYDFNSSKTAISTTTTTQAPTNNLKEIEEKEESKSQVNESNNDNNEFKINNSTQPSTPAAISADLMRPTGATSKQLVGFNNHGNTTSNIINSNNFTNNNNQRPDSRGASNGFATANTAALTQIIPEKPMPTQPPSQMQMQTQLQQQPTGNKRYSYTKNGRRSMDYHEREDRYERSERGGSGGHGQRGNQRDRYDNHRSTRRRDDWNRNRDRINGFRVEEKYSSDNGKDSPLPSPEKVRNLVVQKVL